MLHRLRVTGTARREFRRLPAQVRERVRHSIEALAYVLDWLRSVI